MLQSVNDHQTLISLNRIATGHPVFCILSPHVHRLTGEMRMTTACTVSNSVTPLLELLPGANIPYRDLELSIPLPLPFQLEQGQIEQVTHIHARLVGPQNAPVVMVLGGISANRNACDQLQQGQRVNGWWTDLVGPEQVINTTRYQILSFDFLPGEPASPTNPDSVPDYPAITPADQASIAAVVCEHLGIDQLHAFVGASYGGMIALHFAKLFPHRLNRLIMLCASHRAHPMGCAWRSIQRKIVQLGLDTDQPERALSLARELGMTTYRTAKEFGRRFSSQQEVQAYLESRGLDFIGRMSPARYLALSESIDWHQVNPADVQVPATVIGFRQDQLVPVEDLRSLAQQLPQLTHYFETDSIYGHDAFLKEIPFLEEALCQSGL